MERRPNWHERQSDRLTRTSGPGGQKPVLRICHASFLFLSELPLAGPHDALVFGTDARLVGRLLKLTLAPADIRYRKEADENYRLPIPRENERPYWPFLKTER
jgi:hypothetical protein